MRWMLIPLAAAGLFAQGTEPKPKAEDYQVHAQARDGAIGAEYMVHSFSGQGMTYLARDYLVVEVALYPYAGQEIEVQDSSFALRLNGKKQALLPAGVEVVKMSLDRSEWRDASHVEAGASAGGGTVILGAPRQVPMPIPGQPPQPRKPLPDPGETADRAGVPHESPVTADDLLTQTALPGGQTRKPVSGFIYFPYHGKAGALKSVELLFEDAVLKLL